MTTDRKPRVDEAGRPSANRAFLPRTRTGRSALLLILALFLLAEPPVVYVAANRIRPWVLGMPFLFAWLLFVYAALLVILVWARRQGL